MLKQIRSIGVVLMIFTMFTISSYATCPSGYYSAEYSVYLDVNCKLVIQYCYKWDAGSNTMSIIIGDCYQVSTSGSTGCSSVTSTLTQLIQDHVNDVIKDAVKKYNDGGPVNPVVIPSCESQPCSSNTTGSFYADVSFGGCRSDEFYTTWTSWNGHEWEAGFKKITVKCNSNYLCWNTYVVCEMLDGSICKNYLSHHAENDPCGGVTIELVPPDPPLVVPCNPEQC